MKSECIQVEAEWQDVKRYTEMGVVIGGGWGGVGCFVRVSSNDAVECLLSLEEGMITFL